MASLINLLLSGSKFKIIDERNGTRKWKDLVIIKTTITVPSEVSDLPFEDSSLSSESLTMERLRADMQVGKVITPVAINVIAKVPNIALLESILQLFDDLGHTLTITTKGIYAEKMVLTTVMIDQNAESISSTGVELVFQQGGEVEDKVYDPIQPGDEPTYGIHVQASEGLISSVETLYNKISKNINFAS